MITEDYVSVETANLLREKGFDEVCFKYALNGEIYNNGDFVISHKDDVEVGIPTLQMAMKWLREVYGLFVRITEDMTGNVFEWSVYQKNYGCKASTYVEDSYEAACETAIKYCLENLI